MQCEFSPFDEHKLAVSTAQNFGIIGSGRQYVLHVDATKIAPAATLDTKEGVYDCTWSERDEFHLAMGCGDGSVKLWDLKSNKLLQNYNEHTAEVYAVDWNLVNKETDIKTKREERERERLPFYLVRGITR